MEWVITFGDRKFICELKRVKVRGEREKYIEKIFCREIKRQKTSKEPNGTALH